jgi:ABC-type antimicrobial peptide transport system permease subunit
MNVFERTKEFGVMLALGMTPHQLRTLIATESLIMGTISSIGGIFLATLAVLYHKKFGFDLSPFLGKVSFAGDFYLDLIIHPIFKMSSWLKSVGVMIFVVFLAGLYPAVRASLLNPVETMRS